MIEEAKKDLIEFMKKSNKTQTQVSKEIGFSSAVLSQFISGKYTGDQEKVALQINQYLKLARERLQNRSITEYNPNTKNTQQVMVAATYAHQYLKISVIYGDAGAGKTEALKRYAKGNPGVIMVTANASCKSAKSILNMIATAMDMHPAGSEATIMEMLLDRLKDTNSLIIIDEADHLTLNALQAIRNLYDVAHVGIVLSGNDMMIYQMYNKKNSQSSKFDQMRTRLGMKVKVKNSHFTLDEITTIFPTLESDCAKELLTITAGYSLRVAISVCEYASVLAQAKGENLSSQHIQMAFDSAFRLT